jgi:hypothetical protein
VLNEDILSVCLFFPSGWALMKFGVMVHSEANLIFVCIGPNIRLVLNEAQI